MRLGQSHLAEYKFRHNFQDCLNPISSYGLEIETTSHFFLHCLNYRCRSQILFEKINLYTNIFQQKDLSITKDFLFGSKKLEDDKNNDDSVHTFHGEIQIPVVPIINKQLN